MLKITIILEWIIEDNKTIYCCCILYLFWLDTNCHQKLYCNSYFITEVYITIHFLCKGASIFMKTIEKKHQKIKLHLILIICYANAMIYLGPQTNVVSIADLPCLGWQGQHTRLPRWVASRQRAPAPALPGAAWGEPRTAAQVRAARWWGERRTMGGRWVMRNGGGTKRIKR